MSGNRTVAEGWIPITHGTPSSYNRGCRCDECRASNTARQRASGGVKKHRDRNLAQRVMRDGAWYAPDARHGSHDGYTRFGCRCVPCVVANRVYQTEYRRKRGQGPRQLAECGSRAAYNRHLRRGEETCGPCRAAMAAYARSRRGVS